MKKKLIIIIPIVVLLIVAAVIAIPKVKAYLPYYFDKKGIRQPDIEYTLTIEKSDFENEVASRLKEQGIIVSSERFLGYLHNHYPEFVWYNGIYKLSADMSYEQLCQKLSLPDTRLEYVSFTVPEGKTVRDIAQIVEKSGLCTQAQFLEAADSYDYDYDFVKELEKRDGSLVAYKLEGYLFPATYEFRRDTATARGIVDKMLATFQSYVTDEIIKKAQDMGLDLNELITFSSVVQGEALSDESMTKVSSVFWNRLNSDSFSSLQSDPTTNYARSLRGLESYSQQMFDAYDTYTCKGLPVAPINNPGLEMINAVLSPEDTDYYYFVTDADGNFYYNRTYQEHVNTCYEIGLWKR